MLALSFYSHFVQLIECHLFFPVILTNYKRMQVSTNVLFFLRKTAVAAGSEAYKLA